jgi:hypothetical protein
MGLMFLLRIPVPVVDGATALQIRLTLEAWLKRATDAEILTGVFDVPDEIVGINPREIRLETIFRPSKR